MLLTIINGEDLAAGDSDGFSDPFVRVLYEGKEVARTSHCKKTLNPEWNSSTLVQLSDSWDLAVAFIEFEVWDKDELATKDFLASCRVCLNVIQNTPEPTTVKCKLVRGPMPQGYITITLALSDEERILLSKSSRTDVRDVFPPHNTRFQHLYAPLPRKWHPLNECVLPSNEKVLYLVEEVALTFHVTELNQGVLALMVLSTFRLWFIPYHPVQGLSHEDVHTIPIGKIHKATLSQNKRSFSSSVLNLAIENMDASYYNVSLSPSSRYGEGDKDMEAKRIKTLSNIVTEIEWLQAENNFCAFADLNHQLISHTPDGQPRPVAFNSPVNRISEGSTSRSSFPNSIDVRGTMLSPTGSAISGRRRIRYNPLTEYTRMGATAHPAWRESTINADYELCPTYPSVLFVPDSISDDILLEASKFRSKKRLPVLTWLHPRTGAPLCRSSQPKSGLLRIYNKEDRDLMWAIRDAAFPVDDDSGLPKSSALVHIVDARPEINAKSNALAGKGHESAKHYDRDGFTCASIAFMGIDNIHVVRTSFNQLSQALYQVDDTTFFSTLQKSRWLEHINSVLQGAAEVASHLERGDAVLVHCSDGWDRTSQLSALAQLMLDPYYRTLEGFAVLVEKDWCSFGHMFAKRCAFPTSDDTSPVFLQFVDAVYQLTVQFPTHFQFNEMFLAAVADAVYTSWYGTFQKNCERERREFTEAVPTISLWDTVRASTESYLNPLFNSEHLEPMIPVCKVRLMQLWTSQYQKAISHMRLQQREMEMLSMIRMQDHQLSRLTGMLSSEQTIGLRILQLRSEIQQFYRLISISHEIPDEVATAANPVAKTAILLRRASSVMSVLSPTASMAQSSSSSSVYEAPTSRTRSNSLKVRNGLAQLLGAKPSQANDIQSLKSEMQDLERQLDDLQVIARSMDDQAHRRMQMLRFETFNLPGEVVSVNDDVEPASPMVLSPPLSVTTRPTMTSAHLVNTQSNTARRVALLAMTEFGTHRSLSAPPGRDMRSASSSAYAPMNSPSVRPTISSINSQPVWELDRDAACCKRCKKKFIAVYRSRHHCRCCGYVFCGRCTNHRMQLPEFGYFELVRVCRLCYTTGAEQ
ncbi:myotubularin [Thraustotheca clavata]|uniref:phosphatidylinositol-3,5-bisphosphate 3-phosphatase n=1 Tax=Thraustotheca clavata TaxID=74557 RepID=A0A1V9ZP43_9STRA|nr:myotubularin [Thraustotheca clavata]